MSILIYDKLQAIVLENSDKAASASSKISYAVTCVLSFTTVN